MKRKQYTPAPETDEQRAKRERDEAERLRKYPHFRLEASYRNSNVYWIMLGSDNVPFAQSEFYAGMPNGVPVFEKPESGALPGIGYVDLEAAHRAVTELLEWYATEGAKLGIKAPANINIGH